MLGRKENKNDEKSLGMNFFFMFGRIEILRAEK